MIIGKTYKLKEQLGRGGSGITYAALNTKNNEQVAIKILSLSKLDNWKKIELFEREAKILQQLNHSSIPKYIDYFKVESDDNIDFCLVQQLAPGQSLATLIENGWQPDETTVKEIAEKILNILIYLQQLTPPVIHRDIKPQNIIYQPDTGKLFLVDFGAVKHTYNSTVMASTVVGTYGYMAPEQFRGQALLSTDLYGLGCTLLFLLTGKSPSELPQKKLKIQFNSAVKIDQNLTRWIETLIEPNEQYRYQIARDALDSLIANDFEQNKNSKIPKPDYSNISFKIEGDREILIIPPIITWHKYTLHCWMWIIYCAFILLNIFFVSTINLWLGYLYGIWSLFEIFNNWLSYKLQFYINSIVLLTFSSIVAFIYGEFFQLIPFLIILLDSLGNYKLRIRIIKDFLFPTKIQIVKTCDRKYLKIQPKILDFYNKDDYSFITIYNGMKLTKQQINSIGCIYDYVFGYLLSSKEKKWLQQELKNKLH